MRLTRLAACPVCGSRRSRAVYDQPDWFLLGHGRTLRVRYVLCQGCSQAYVNPRLDDAAIEALYGAKYWEQDALILGAKQARLKDAFVRDRLRVAAERLHLLRAWGVGGLAARKKGSYLEIGSATGFLPKLLKDRGWRVQAVEPTPLAEFSARAGVPTVRGFFDPSVLEGRSFDLVAMFHVFEHVKDPVSFLRSLRPAVKRGGALWLEVPDLASPRLVDMSHPHIFFYTAQTLRAVLARGGYRVLRLESYQSRNSAYRVLHAFAAPGRPGPRPRDRARDVRAALDDALALRKAKLAAEGLAPAYGRLRVPRSEFRP